MNSRVWFKSISLENVRSFGEKQTINFTDKDGNAARWNVILGDNGTGKTTVLNAIIASLDTNLVNIGAGFDYFLRSKKIEPKISRVDESFIHEQNIKLTSREVKVHYQELQGIVVPITESIKHDSKGEYNSVSSRRNLFAYGALRKMSRSLVTESQPRRFFLTDDADELINAEEWLVQSEYVALKQSKFRLRYSTVLNTLKLLFRQEVSDIYISTETGTPKVYFETHYGAVRLHGLSLGYKTLIAWMVDFAKGLLDRYPDSENPLAEPAVCLVDEIDLHLHPKFQRSIIKFLTETFPNTQFIVTAHSPLIVVAAEERPLDANIILLKREGDQTVVVNDPVDVSKWSVDQILNSDLFGHVPPRSQSLNELRLERDKLLAKAKLTKKDNTLLTELDEKIGFVPFGQDQAEIQAETIIQQLADVLRKQQQVP